MTLFLEFLAAAAAGGFITSFAEFKLEYNLIDLIVDKVKAVLGLAEGEAKSIESKLPKL